MKIAVTAGDCNGIGLEAFLKAVLKLQTLKNLEYPEFYLFINTKTLKEYIQKTNFRAEFKDHTLVLENISINLIECHNYTPVQFGQETNHSGKHGAESIYSALEMIESKEADAILTLPISKYTLRTSGYKFPGHTELIAAYFGISKPLMILASGNTRIALATIHVPIKNVPALLKPDTLAELITLFHQSLQIDFGIAKPKLAVLGLNPHAGENGGIGMEEINIIKPTIEAIKESCPDISGPHPADGFFGFGDYKKYDGIMAMYHDQGLIPLKLIANGNGVNFTAGLPIVRTSPDHGTAFQIAGKNKADCTSTFESILMAISIVENRKKFGN